MSKGIVKEKKEILIKGHYYNRVNSGKIRIFLVYREEIRLQISFSLSKLSIINCHLEMNILLIRF